MSTTPSTDETIPIHISVFISAILNNKRSFMLDGDDTLQHEVMKIGAELARLLLHFDPEGKYAHVQPPDDYGNETKCWRLWNRQAWRDSSERYAQQKVVSEKHRQHTLLREDLILQLADKLEAEGMALEREHAVLQARYFIMKNKIEHCRFFGVDISMLGGAQERVVVIGEKTLEDI